MTALHLPTLLMALAAVTLLTSMMVALTATLSGGWREGAWWALGNLVTTVGYTLTTLDQSPLWVHGVLGYGLFALGQGLLVAGFRTFAGLPGPVVPVVLITLLGLAGAAVFTFAWPDASARERSSALLSLVLCLWIATWLWRSASPMARIAAQITALGYGVLAASVAAWLAWPWLALVWPALGTPWPAPLLAATLLLCGQVCVLAGQVLMLTQRHAGMLAQAAATDTLTGAHNRLGFEELATRRIARAAQSQQPMALLLFDIDNFKNINDSLGHPAGDEVLRRVVRRALRTLRPDDLLGRWGGEEFVALLVGVNAQHAQAAAERLLHNIGARRIKLDGATKLRVTVSVGLAQGLPIPENSGAQLQALVAAADAALYEAKRSGRNQVRVGYGGTSEPPSSVDLVLN